MRNRARRILLAAPLLVAGCGGPPPRTYVLSTPAEPVPALSSETGRPVVELRRVAVPDYLDTVDIQSRDGQNEVAISRTGQWGERLSVGVTRALTQDLTRRSPRLLIVRSATPDQNATTLLVTVDAFDVRADRRCVLSARWTLLDPAQHVEASDHAIIVTIVGAGSGDVKDADVVAAMARAVNELSVRIAATMARRLGSAPR